MKRSSFCLVAALLAAPLVVAGASTPPPAKSGPPTIPYRCGDGREAVAVYESGSDYRHARALVTYDGRTIEMRAAPALYGLRYRGEPEGGAAPLAWSLRGEEARLTESPDVEADAGGEREIARCTRVRRLAADPHEGQGGDHGESH